MAVSLLRGTFFGHWGTAECILFQYVKVQGSAVVPVAPPKML